MMLVGCVVLCSCGNYKMFDTTCTYSWAQIKLPDGTIILADEISPDTARLWDSKTGEKLDKDRFRRDLGGVEDAYQEVLRRVLGK